jgi:outer membrane immunogenic protein
VGYAENGWLLYATGGGAVGEVQTNISSALFAATTTVNSHDVKGGYAVGGGLETQFSGGWSGKIEYLYMALGTVSSQVTLPDRAGPVSGEIRDHIIRVGLNHRFGGSGGPYAAYAADKSIAYKAAPVVTALDWTGPYLGINVGYGVGRNPSLELQTLNPGIGEIGAEQVVFSPAGIIAGGQAGFNWQRGLWVIGAEFDVQGTGQKDRTCVYSCSTQHVVTTQSLDWFATLRGRLGVAASGWLWYVTAGGAAAQVKTSVATSVNQNLQPAVAFGNFGNLKGGWTAGVGVEAQFAGNWSWKVEYLYVDLGRVDTSLTAVGLIGPNVHTISSDIRDHVFRAGVNYRFGGFGPVAAAY